MRIRAVIAALPLLLLAACGSSGGDAATGTGTGTESSGASVAPGTTLGPTVPPASSLAAPVPTAELPTATGKFGDKPTLTFPKNNPVPSLQRVILSEGTGPLTETGDYLETNYLGQIWGGKVFDNSYDRKATSTFQISTGSVVSGWVVGLAGVKVGSRVMLVLPPADGYGAAGKSDAGITGTDTLVFVVDVVKAIKKNATGQTDAVPQVVPAGIPMVTGALGTEPKITIPSGLAQPTANTVHVLAKGTGPAVKEGQILAQLVLTDWGHTQTNSTWPAAGDSAADAATKGLQQLPVETGGPLAGLVGVPVGSRVLVLIAPSTDQQTGQQTQAAVAVLDVVAQAS